MDLLHDRIAAGLLDDVTLIFEVDGAVDRRLKLAKLVMETGVVLECPALSGEDEVARFLSARLRRAGKSMARAAVAALVERSGTDAQALCHETDKLMAYVGEREEITVEDVREMVAPTVELSVFELVDAVAERRPRDALDRLEGMLGQQAEPFLILAMLIRQFRLLVQGRYLLDSGLVEPRLVRLRAFDFNRVITEKGDSGSLLDEWKARTAEVLPPDPRQNLLGQHYFPFWKTLNMAQRLPAEMLEAALERLLQCDLALKSSHLEPRQEMELLVADLCTRMAAGATLDLETLMEA
ncbi:MAG: DNA polymerase III subunit delta [Armatimonadetes bacterium]|nr:DNA polymerase III subunit delta [Armatimonadota bacterium]